MKIKTDDLTKKYRRGPSEITAVDKINFEVDEAKFVVVIGPSGSGKSTLLNLIGLNDSPTCGKVLIDDMDTSMLSGSARRKIRLSRMGFVFQTFNLFPTLNASENVEMPMSLAGISRGLQKEKASRLLDAVGLGARVSHRPKELSMGEMQRVALARALANDPEVIIADEPTGELDSTTAKEIVSLLSDIRQNGKTTVLVATHDEKVVGVADEVFTIQDGKLKQKN